MPERPSERGNGKERALLGPAQMGGWLSEDDLPEGKMLPDWQRVLAQDYVSALILNEVGEAMIFERNETAGGMSSWQVIGGFVERDEDPMTAVKRALLEATGYSSNEWLYLGSYMLTEADEPMGVGHFFCARGAYKVARGRATSELGSKIKWVSQRDLKYALLDGRVSVVSYAITISMALLTVLD